MSRVVIVVPEDGVSIEELYPMPPGLKDKDKGLFTQLRTQLIANVSLATELAALADEGDEETAALLEHIYRQACRLNENLAEIIELKKIFRL